jgi:hypothetical protein
MPSQRDIASGLAKNDSCHGSGVVPAPAESRLAFFDVYAAHVRTNPSFGIVDETLGTLARGMLPRLRHVFEQHQALHRQAVEAIVNV